MVNANSRYTIATLPSGHMLIADYGKIPQDIYLISPSEFAKVFNKPVTFELPADQLLKMRVSLSPELEFSIERFVVSPSGTICAVGRHCLALLHPVGDVGGYHENDSFLFRCFPVCRYFFHPKSTLDVLHVCFATADNEYLSVLSSDCSLRLFDSSYLSPESLIAPYRTVNLLLPQRSRGVISQRITGSRISLAKCEPFVSIVFLSDASVTSLGEREVKTSSSDLAEVSSFIPFLALRSNGDLYFGFVDIAEKSAAANEIIEKAVYDCQLAGPLKLQIPEIDAEESSRYYESSASSLHFVSHPSLAKGVPLVVISSANGIISHYLLMTGCGSENSLRSLYASSGSAFNAKSTISLDFPDVCLHAIEKLRISSNPQLKSTSTTGWLYDPNCLRISSFSYNGTFSYLATASSSVFRISLPWLMVPTSVSDSAFVARIADEPTFVESLFSLSTNLNEIVSVGSMHPSNTVVVAVGSSLYGVPGAAKPTIAHSLEQPFIADDTSPLFVPSPLPLTENVNDVLPQSEDYVAVIQRALARQAHLNAKSLSGNVTMNSNSEDQLSQLYTAASGAVAILAKEYFERTDAAARHISRLNTACEARRNHVSNTLEVRVDMLRSEFSTKILPKLASRIDDVADRLAALGSKLSTLSIISRSNDSRKGNALEETCVAEGFVSELTDVELNLAHINSLYSEVDEKALYLSTELAAFTERYLKSTNQSSQSSPSNHANPPSLLPLFETLGADIRLVADELRRVREEVERIDASIRI